MGRFSWTRGGMRGLQASHVGCGHQVREGLMLALLGRWCFSTALGVASDDHTHDAAILGLAGAIAAMALQCR